MTELQLSFFGPRPAPQANTHVAGGGAEADLNCRAPSVRQSETGNAAAQQVQSHTGRLRALVYRALDECGGMTDHEIQDALGLAGDCERPRRRELERAGYVRDSGQKRETPAGRLAVVWELTGKAFNSDE